MTAVYPPSPDTPTEPLHVVGFDQSSIRPFSYSPGADPVLKPWVEVNLNLSRPPSELEVGYTGLGTRFSLQAGVAIALVHKFAYDQAEQELSAINRELESVSERAVERAQSDSAAVERARESLAGVDFSLIW